ncbi:MAG: flagellar export protein FliJ [Treponema sp.]|jgi:flagellar FliJ protein|nr:flagellar export protein FliJ [Treponema sp.]
MKRFRFGPEKILELRKHREQEAKIALGRAVSELTDIENQLKDLALLRRKTLAERLTASGFPQDEGGAQSAFLAGYYRNYEFYLQRLDRRREELLEAAARARLKVEEERKAYLESSQERKVLDKLKEKRAVEHHRAVFAEETKNLDDTALRRDNNSLSQGEYHA